MRGNEKKKQKQNLITGGQINIGKVLINILIIKYVAQQRINIGTYKILVFLKGNTHMPTETHTWQMVNHEVDRAVKQACSLCPPTQHFAQCVYQMEAFYQGVADTSFTQSSVKQGHGSPPTPPCPAKKQEGGVAVIAAILHSPSNSKRDIYSRVCAHVCK